MDTLRTLAQPIRALQDGDRETAKRLLAAFLRADPHNVQAWLLMSEAVDTEGHKRECLLRVLSLEPDNQAARAGLAQLAQHRTPPAQDRSRDVPIPLKDRSATTERDPAVVGMQLAGGLLLTLVVGLALLVLTLTQVIPQARQETGSRGQTPSAGQPLYTATLWCPSCKREGRSVVLSTRIGANFYRGARANELPHGTRISVLRYRWSALERQYYALISAEGKRGWVPETQIRR